MMSFQTFGKSKAVPEETEEASSWELPSEYKPSQLTLED